MIANCRCEGLSYSPGGERRGVRTRGVRRQLRGAGAGRCRVRHERHGQCRRGPAAHVRATATPPRCNTGSAARCSCHRACCARCPSTSTASCSCTSLRSGRARASRACARTARRSAALAFPGEVLRHAIAHHALPVAGLRIQIERRIQRRRQRRRGERRRIPRRCRCPWPGRSAAPSRQGRRYGARRARCRSAGCTSGSVRTARTGWA